LLSSLPLRSTGSRVPVQQVHLTFLGLPPSEHLAVGDGTATESDSGLEDCIAAMTQTQTQPRETQEQSQVDDDGSATESDIDDDHVDATVSLVSANLFVPS
jgi:hypothetical protein